MGSARGHRGRSWRGLLLAGVLSLAAGGVINVAVAWACFCAPRWRMDQRRQIALRGWPPWLGVEWPEPGRTDVSWNTYVTLTRTWSLEQTTRPFAGPTAATVYAEWSGGLPLRSMGVWYCLDNRPALPNGWMERSMGTLYPPAWLLPRMAARGEALPGRPLWAGFAVNSAFYGAAVLLAVLGPGAARRGLRRRRGVCEACGYPAGVSEECTECGATLRAAGGRRTA